MKFSIWDLMSDRCRTIIATAYPYWAARHTEQLNLRALRK